MIFDRFRGRESLNICIIVIHGEGIENNEIDWGSKEEGVLFKYLNVLINI